MHLLFILLEGGQTMCFICSLVLPITAVTIRRLESIVAAHISRVATEAASPEVNLGLIAHAFFRFQGCERIAVTRVDGLPRLGPYASRRPHDLMVFNTVCEQDQALCVALQDACALTLPKMTVYVKHGLMA
jgi:hypothetical protein